MKEHVLRFLALMTLLCHLVLVSSQDVDGVVDGSALLPCSFSGVDPTKVSIFWRTETGSIVLDIKNGKEDVTQQDRKYKGRVSSSEDGYAAGNFSIIMKDMKREDAGKYICQILPRDDRSTVTLKVSDTPVTGSTHLPPLGGATGGHQPHVFILSALSLLLLYIHLIN